MLSQINHKTLSEIELFNDRTIGNVPFHIFVLTCFVTFFSFYLSFVVGLFFAVTLFPVLFYFHRNDPQALTVYFKSKSLPAQINHHVFKEAELRRVS